MSKKIMILSLILLLTSLSCVSAENITYNHAEIFIDDYVGSDFNDLQRDINNADCELNLTHDYEFALTDYFGVDINRNLVINGNNHIIDAKDSSMIFDITSSNVIINNLILKNSHAAINAMHSNITTNNVTFINNSNEYTDGGAVYAYRTHYQSINDHFIDSKSEHGSAIYIEDGSILDVVNGTFKSSFGLEWGLIAAKYCEVRIANTTFSNISSNYSSVLYGKSIKGVIKNSKFLNLHSDKTAGAIAIKGVDGSFTFDNCTFINSTSRKNGGALYFDLICEDMNEWDLEGGINSIIYLRNSEFTNCSSKFGGAYLQLNGKLDVSRCVFTNNYGTAGYTSHADCNIINCAFNDNPQGSVYFDKGTLKIINSKFTNSTSVYIQESNYTISSTLFENTALYSNFDEKNCVLANNTVVNSKTGLNMKNYTEVICNDLSKIQTLKGKTFPANTVKSKYFNLKDYGLVSSVKNQGATGSCWVFAAVSAFESALLKLGIDMDISENSVYNAALQYSPIGVEYLFEGGESIFAAQYFLSWRDLICEEEEDYDELGRISGTPISNNTPHYTTSIIKLQYDIENVKKALVDYGALYVPTYLDYDYYDYMNMTNYAFYNNEHETQTHAVNIIGWDDSYSRYNFKTAPPKDGAWIVKNSWGDEWGNDGYYYMSYYDFSLKYSFEILGFKINPEIYTKIYQHEYFSNYFENEAWYYSEDYEEISYAQTYTSKGNDLIGAVGTYFECAEVEYIINILLNNKVVYTQNGLSQHQGFEIIKLNSLVSVNKNEKFTIEITRYEMPYGFLSRAKYDTGKSYYRLGDKKYPISDEIPVIKVYTTENPIKSGNTVKFFSQSKIKYAISNIKGKKITIKVDGEKYIVNVKNKKATLKLNLKAGTHKITSYCNGKKIINQVLIKTTIKSKRTIKLPYKAKNTVKITYTDSNGKALKNKQVKFKFNTKTYTRKTDKNGVLKIKLSQKLKKGKYYISCTNPKTKETAKITLKIVSKKAKT